MPKSKLDIGIMSFRGYKFIQIVNKLMHMNREALRNYLNFYNTNNVPTMQSII